MTTMPKPYAVHFTPDQLDAMSEEADELCDTFMKLVHGHLVTHPGIHGGGVWCLMLTRLLVDWLSIIDDGNEKETRSLHAKVLRGVCGEVMHGLAERRAGVVARNVH